MITPTEAAKFAWRHSGLKAMRQQWQLGNVRSAWSRLDHALPVMTPTRPDTAFIIPPDPVQVTASLGDQAMLLVLAARLEAQCGITNICVGTADERGDAATRAMGWTPVRLFDDGSSLETSLGRIEATGAAQMALVGADVLDGALDPAFSGRLLMLVDAMRQRGRRVIVTGFSVGQDLNAGLRDVFARLHAAGALNVRDPVSVERLATLIGERPKLVADMAFLLQPAATGRTRSTQEWISAQRTAGRRILGFNLHPFPHDLTTGRERAKLVQVAATLIDRLTAHGLSLVLLPHDSRTGAGDELVLDDIARAVSNDSRAYLRSEDTGLRADEAKAMAGMTDLVMTARMHLAIAALGTGTPVLVVGGPAKLDGLLRHVDLPPTHRLSLADFLAGEKAKDWIMEAMGRHAALRQHVGAQISAIKGQAELNFEGLVAD